MKRLWAFLFPLALLAGSGPLPAATPEVQVKAAYLFKLAAFVRWPGDAAAANPFTICVAGRADIAGSLATLTRDQQVDGKRVAVVALGAGQDAAGCQVLFLGRGAETARAMLKATAGGPVLTVTDRSGGTRGGVIEFMLERGKVRLSVDRGAANSHKLELSSKLMDAAAEVKP